MFPPDELNKILRDALDRIDANAPGCVLNQNGNGNSSSNSNSGGNGSHAVCDGNKSPLTPSQALVIGGILGGVLSVESVLVDKSQTVEIVLSGSLKQKTKLEKMLDQIGSMPFDEVVKAMLERLDK